MHHTLLLFEHLSNSNLRVLHDVRVYDIRSLSTVELWLLNMIYPKSHKRYASRHWETLYNSYGTK
jgi:hypothetical protein